MFAVGPDVLHRVQFRRRQILHFQTAFLVADKLLCDFAAVRRQASPNQQDAAIDVAEQVFEELDDLLGLDGLFEDLKVEVPERDAGDDRQGFPVEVELEDRRLPPWRPGAPPMRPLTQTAFVLGRRSSGPLFGLLFDLGPSACAAIRRSRPHSVPGRGPPVACTLQFNCRRMRQTCPG